MESLTFAHFVGEKGIDDMPKAGLLNDDGFRNMEAGEEVYAGLARDAEPVAAAKVRYGRVATLVRFNYTERNGTNDRGYDILSHVIKDLRSRGVERIQTEAPLNKIELLREAGFIATDHTVIIDRVEHRQMYRTM